MTNDKCTYINTCQITLSLLFTMFVDTRDIDVIAAERIFYATYDVVKDYEFVEKIAYGGFSTVWLAFDKKNERKVAIKISKSFEGNSSMLNEYFIMNKLDNSYLMKGISFYHGMRTSHLVLPYYRRDLFSVIQDNDLLDENYIKVILHDIGSAIKHMHNHDLVHRDIKPENIMFDEVTNKFILTDFGNSEHENNMTITKLRGTPNFFAPEIVRGFHNKNEVLFTIGKPIDMYALGITLYIMATKTSPNPIFAHSKETLRWLENPDVLEEVDKIHRSDDLKDLLRKLLDINPVRRMTIREFFYHPFMILSK
ncbi:serine/threonine-protein kinase [Paramecium bursaria Chlorella virus IL-5-2s1]|uniref:Protein kinase A248R n=1 Tax=Chlorella virus TaxID=10507 RepID=Q671M3_9PHYC|nr:protein kinase A248R [Chlorella virus]AGE54198.1 serine/threonine-protein kinase [Paramecium bursaria Chlorella virus IL-5-2s1]